MESREAAGRAEAAGRGRRWPVTRNRVIAAFVALLIALAAAGAFVVSRSYGPLEAGVTSGPRPVDEREYRIIEPPGSGPRIFAVDGNAAGAFGFVMGVINTGRLPLTLEAPPSDSTQVLQQAEVRISDRQPFGSAGEDYSYVPLDGVRIEPGEMRELYVKFRWIDTCPSGDAGSMSPGGVRVRYGAYGVFHREQTIELPFELAIMCGPLPRPDGNFVIRGYTRAEIAAP